MKSPPELSDKDKTILMAYAMSVKIEFRFTEQEHWMDVSPFNNQTAMRNWLAQPGKYVFRIKP